MGLQTKLLGALERRQVRRVGATAMRAIDVRVIAASNRDLAREVNRGHFRADLFYRLAVVRVRVPPLRERLDDIPLLIDVFLQALARRHGARPLPALSAVALARLAAQPWPGNVRELRNAVERAALLDPHLGPPSAPASPIAPFVEARQLFVDGFERRYLHDILDAAGHNVTEAARQAGVERGYFYRLMRRLGVEPRRGE
jgi:DNA-binding NtrC family response regulator